MDLDHLTKMHRGLRGLQSKVQKHKQNLKETQRRNRGQPRRPEKQFSPEKFSRFITKTTNWHNNKNSFQAKKFFQNKMDSHGDKSSRKGKSSFVSFNYLQGLVQVKPQCEVEKEEDFFSKDIRKKNVSFLQFTRSHFVFDR